MLKELAWSPPKGWATTIQNGGYEQYWGMVDI